MKLPLSASCQLAPSQAELFVRPVRLPAGQPPRWAVALALAAVSIIWGSTYLAIRVARTSLPPLLLAGTRFLLAGTLLYAGLRWRGVPRPTGRAWGRATGAGILLLGMGNGGVTLEEQYLPSDLAALLAATVPFWLVLLAWLSGRAPRPSRWVTAGLGAGLLGVWLVARAAGAGAVLRPGHPGLGITIALLSALAWAVGSLYSRQQPATPSLWLNGSLHMLCGDGALVLVGLWRGEAATWQPAATTAAAWVALAYLVLAGSLVAFSAYTWLLQAVSPVLAGSYALVNPVIAVLLGVAVDGESLSRTDRSNCRSARLSRAGTTSHSYR